MSIFSKFLAYVTKDAKITKTATSKTRVYYILLTESSLKSMGVSNISEVVSSAANYVSKDKVTFKNRVLYFHADNANNKVIAANAASKLSSVVKLGDNNTSDIKAHAMLSSFTYRNMGDITYTAELRADKTKDTISVRQHSTSIMEAAWNVQKKGLTKKLFSAVAPVVRNRIHYMSNLLGRIFAKSPGKTTPKVTSAKLPTSTVEKRVIKTTTDVKYKDTTETYLVVDQEAAGLDIQHLFMAMNKRIAETVKDNMGRGFNPTILNFQTGRFNESVDIVGIVNDRQRHLLVFYEYMRYPYGTFDPGGKQYRTDRIGPTAIIDKSVRELAIELVFNRFSVTPVGR